MLPGQVLHSHLTTVPNQPPAPQRNVVRMSANTTPSAGGRPPNPAAQRSQTALTDLEERPQLLPAPIYCRNCDKPHYPQFGHNPSVPRCVQSGLDNLGHRVHPRPNPPLKQCGALPETAPEHKHCIRQVKTAPQMLQRTPPVPFVCPYPIRNPRQSHPAPKSPDTHRKFATGGQGAATTVSKNVTVPPAVSKRLPVGSLFSGPPESLSVVTVAESFLESYTSSPFPLREQPAPLKNETTVAPPKERTACLSFKVSEGNGVQVTSFPSKCHSSSDIHAQSKTATNNTDHSTTLQGRSGSSNRLCTRSQTSENATKNAAATGSVPRGDVDNLQAPPKLSVRTSTQRITRLTTQAKKPRLDIDSTYTEKERGPLLKLGMVVWAQQNNKMKTGRLVEMCSNGSYVLHCVDESRPVVPVRDLRLDVEFKPCAPTSSHDSTCSACWVFVASGAIKVDGSEVQKTTSPPAPISNMETPTPPSRPDMSEEEEEEEEEEGGESSEEGTDPLAHASTGGSSMGAQVKERDTSELTCVVCGRGGCETASADICYRMMELDEQQVTYLRKNKAGVVVTGTDSNTKLGVHEYCLFFIGGLDEDWTGKNPLHFDGVTYSLCQLTSKLKKAAAKTCHVCRQRGATTTCAHKGCKQAFHYPCALQEGLWCNYTNGDIHCNVPAHNQGLPQPPPADAEPCLICLESVSTPLGGLIAPGLADLVAGYKDRPALQCPNLSCHLWAHFGCIQSHVYARGALKGNCWGCTVPFEEEMKRWGIRIAKGHQPTWETEDSHRRHYDGQYQPRTECGACECYRSKKKGNIHRADFDEASEDWRMMGCETCRPGKGHAHCINVQMKKMETDKWSCLQCTSEQQG